MEDELFRRFRVSILYRNDEIASTYVCTGNAGSEEQESLKSLLKECKIFSALAELLAFFDCAELYQSQSTKIQHAELVCHKFGKLLKIFAFRST